jgi:ubiquinone/menaquinone biosynthesis C-methylase UbiE
MIGLARDRVAAAGWSNVSLVEAPMEEADLRDQFDALLFNYTHDVLQSDSALERIFSSARPGARIAIAGIKHPPALLFPLRLYRLIKARPYVSTLRGLDRPWRLLSGYVTDLRVEQVMLGTNYLACGTTRK